MAQEFHLKLITERTGGGDPIRREKHVPGPELSIGRAADSDIVLTDLVIDPKHAKMRFAGPGRVTIESISGVPFQVGDKSHQRIDLDVASKPVVAFASYSLALEPGPEGGAVITITQTDHTHYPTRSIFSLQSKVFGRRRMAWTFATGIFLICLLVPLLLSGVLAPRIHPDQQWSSGPLSKSHAFLESDCKSCHTKSFVAVQDTSCKACHQAGHDPAAAAKVLAVSKDKGSPFETRLVFDHSDPKRMGKGAPPPPGAGAKVSWFIQRTLGHPTDRCASCHVEHSKPGKPAIEKARAIDPNGPPLGDKPTAVAVQDCQTCHAAGLKARLGGLSTVKDTPTWADHAAFSPLIMTSAEGETATFQRAALQGSPKEQNGLTFLHRTHVDPTGGVARQAVALARYGAPLKCVSCHERDASEKGFQPIEMERACGDCHSLAYGRGPNDKYPHGDEKGTMARAGGGSDLPSPDRSRPGTIRPAQFGMTVAPSAVSGSPFRKGGVCFDCHTITWTEGGAPVVKPVKLAAVYMPRGVFDHSIAAHDGPAKNARASERAGIAAGKGFKCEDCHAATTSGAASDVLIPDKGLCLDCHTAKVSKPKAIQAKTDCAECHSFHVPGRAAPKPGHPALETLRWSAVAVAKGPGA